jgi:TolA-binding protein
MMRRPMTRRAIRATAIAVVFMAGYLTATVTRPDDAQAQVGEMMKQAAEGAAQSGGTLGTVAQLGTAITGMQENVNQLQEHINTLEKIKAALGGG